MLYGDGGASKTTLSVDGVAHLAAGIPWLGLDVPRPVRIVVVENEGPRGRFRRKLRRKVHTWDGPPFIDNVRVLDEPWTRFSFADEEHRASLAAGCGEFKADLVVVGPLVTIGTEGGGTPDEVKAFEALLRDFRGRLDRALAIWLAHHENKAGDVSGAWERMPDTLIHAWVEGKGRTKIHWRKARWSSDLHNETWVLPWIVEREGFEVAPKDERDVRAEVRALYEADPKWRTLGQVYAPKGKSGVGRHKEDVRAALDALKAEGWLSYSEAAPGRQKGAKCWGREGGPSAPDHPDHPPVSHGSGGGLADPAPVGEARDHPDGPGSVDGQTTPDVFDDHEDAAP
jgi:hypothetical protein